MPKGSQVRQLNAGERHWVIVRHANSAFWKELWERLGHLKVWIGTIATVAGGTLAWVRSDDLAAVLAAIVRLFLPK